MDLLSARYRVVLTDSVLARAGYLAGPDDARADEFNQLVRDPDVRAIIMARGGYGALRILDRLDADALRRQPKLIVGFSDATAILHWALRCAGVRPVHGPMVGQLGRLPEDDVRWLFQILEQAAPAGRLPLTLAARGARVSATAREGVLTGGNLCLLAHLAGTPYAVDAAEQVLLLEEVGERPYRIDRFLTHLGLTGLFDRVVAAVIGELTDCQETVHGDHPTAEAVVDERLRRFGVPALAGVPLAHGLRNLALPMGVRCALDQRAGTLELLDSAVL